MEKYRGAPKERFLGRVSGISPTVELRGFRNSIQTLERAVKERVFYVKNDGAFVEPPQPLPGAFAHRLEQVDGLLERHLPKATPLTKRGFVETFRGHKRKVYERAVESLNTEPFSPDDAKVKVFVKFEKTDFTRKADPVPRVISPRDPRYNVQVGRFLRPVEERIFHSLGALFEGNRTVFKGMNAVDSASAMLTLWGSFRNPVAVGLDASRFDQHVSLDALRWEHSQYLRCFPRLKWRRKLASLLRLQETNLCTGVCKDGRLEYKKVGGRMSGDMNTSLGNCVLMCSMIKQYSLDRGVRTLLANNGDDCVVFMEACDLGKFSAGLNDWFLEMGFNMTVEEPVYEFERIEFCQTQPVRYGGPTEYVMVRHPKWAIAKDTVSVHGFRHAREFRQWLGSVGVGGLAMTGGIPVFQDFYQKYVDTSRGLLSKRHEQSWGVRSLARGCSFVYREPLPETRYSFWRAFGITPDEQVVLEEFYRSVDLDCAFQSDLGFAPTMPYDV